MEDRVLGDRLGRYLEGHEDQGERAQRMGHCGEDHLRVVGDQPFLLPCELSPERVQSFFQRRAHQPNCGQRT